MNTQISTGRVRFSFVNILQPRAGMNGGAPKYGVTLLIPKTDLTTLNKIQSAIEAAKASYLAKNSGKQLPPALKSTLHDGDGLRPSGEPFGKECTGCYVITVSSNTRPKVFNADKTEMFDLSELYSGCYGRAIINFYVFNNTGNVGVTAGLNGIMKTEDGPPLSGGVITADDWDDDVTPAPVPQPQPQQPGQLPQQAFMPPVAPQMPAVTTSYLG